MQEPIDLNWKEFGSALLNATPNGVAVFDNALQALISNQPARNCLGLYPGAFLSATIPSLTASARSDNYRKIIQKAIKLGEVDSTVLILGESGTGKGVVADLEKKVLAAALEKGKTQANAAKLLSINQSTIARKMKKYGLDRSDGMLKI